VADVEPMPFATVADLRERWPDMPPGADEHAAVLLDDASQFILDVCPTAANASASTRRRIVCSVVRRSMESSGIPAGVESFQESAGPFQQTFRPANTGGDFYLTKSEKKALGEGAQRAFGVTVAAFSATVTHRPWCSLMLGATYCSCGADLTGEGPLWEA
jgi:hypothetical protein